MVDSTPIRNGISRQFPVGDVCGALGDSITVLPLIVAIGALSDFSIGMMLAGFGVFQILWGVHYSAPISVEPMKALAALIIVGSLTVSEFALAGILAGFVLIGIGRIRLLDRLETYIGTPVARGIQLAVAVLLIEMGLELSLANNSLALVAMAVVLVLGVVGLRQSIPLAILGLGFGIAFLQAGGLAATLPQPSMLLFEAPIRHGAVLGAVGGQLAMTIGNAAVATSLLLADYYDRAIAPDDLATSMGAMNVLAVPIGMAPMCHGSGGVAGKYAFGATSYRANIILGGLYLGLALFAGSLIVAFPMALLGVVLVVISLQLAKTSLQTDHYAISIGVAVLSVGTNLGVGFIAGVIVYSLDQALGSPISRLEAYSMARVPSRFSHLNGYLGV